MLLLYVYVLNYDYIPWTQNLKGHCTGNCVIPNSPFNCTTHNSSNGNIQIVYVHQAKLTDYAEYDVYAVWAGLGTGTVSL